MGAKLKSKLLLELLNPDLSLIMSLDDFLEAFEKGCPNLLTSFIVSPSVKRRSVKELCPV